MLYLDDNRIDFFFQKLKYFAGIIVKQYIKNNKHNITFIFDNEHGNIFEHHEFINVGL
jgi:hypothetical protein